MRLGTQQSVAKLCCPTCSSMCSTRLISSLCVLQRPTSNSMGPTTLQPAMAMMPMGSTQAILIRLLLLRPPLPQHQ